VTLMVHGRLNVADCEPSAIWFYTGLRCDQCLEFAHQRKRSKFPS
jgi:hypothetical protein